MISNEPMRFRYPHLAGCGCESCCKVARAHEWLDEEVASRIKEMTLSDLKENCATFQHRGRKDRIGRVVKFSEWLRDKVEFQIYDDHN